MPRRLWIIAILLVAPLSAQEVKKKPLAIEDLYLMESVKAPTLFPKEEKLVYERVWIDPKTKLERHSLWLVDGKRENRKPLELGEPDGRSPVISPNGAWIAFLSSRRFPAGAKQVPSVPPYSDAGVDIWMYHVKSGRVSPLGGPDRPWGRVLHDGFYGRVAFSMDSTKLVFVADDGADPRSKDEIANNVEIVRPDQGEGYTGYGPAQLWIGDIESKKITRLTNDDIWYGDPQWSPDGKSLVVVANKTKDRESVRYSINKNFDLFLVDLATKKQTQLTTNPGPDVSPRWSPDGKRIAYLSCPRKGPHRDILNLSIMAPGSGGNPRVVFDHHDPNLKPRSNKHGFDLPKFPAPAYPIPNDSPSRVPGAWQDETSIWINPDVGIWSHVVPIDILTGAVREPSEKTRKDERRWQLLYPSPFCVDPLEDRLYADVKIVKWTYDGFNLEGIFTFPRPEIAKPPFKLIVYPHGGPHSRSASDFTVQLFAAHGYAVFQPNFRGSSGYGKKFLDADRLDLGGGDMRDILTGIDKLVKDGVVDPQRQFVFGTSYGGFMTSWLVGHTNQFKAAVAVNAVTDMNMMYGLTDIQSWTTWELGGLPWQQPERYRKHSPLTYADKVKTPTLILHSRDDRRCPLPMGKAFHQALLANGVPTQMVIYPSEGHAIRQPRHREDLYRRVLAWFAKYDQ